MVSPEPHTGQTAWFSGVCPVFLAVPVSAVTQPAVTQPCYSSKEVSLRFFGSELPNPCSAILLPTVCALLGCRQYKLLTKALQFPEAGLEVL